MWQPAGAAAGRLRETLTIRLSRDLDMHVPRLPEVADPGVHMFGDRGPGLEWVETEPHPDTVSGR